jgi:predicted outer membrane repeat protein
VRRFTLLLVVAACDSETAVDTNVDDTDAPFTIPVNPDVDDDGHLAVTSGGDDCNDEDFFVHPGATEHCDGVDEDCDLDIDENAIDGDLYYLDDDMDGYGDPNTEVKSCQPQAGAAANAGDCDDDDPMRNPGAEEICNDGFDDDCLPGTFETAMIGDQGFSNLDDAIAASASGGEIQLCPGVVFAKNVTVDKPVTITSWDGTRAGSIIDGGVAGGGAMFIVDGGELTLKSVTVARANDGAITSLSAGGGAIVVDDCLFEDNTAIGNGGAIAGTDITITGSDFQGNDATNGGAVYGSAPGLLTITDSTVTGNDATNGGGFYSTGTTVLAGVTLTLNDADDGGGGYVSGAGATVALIDTLFSENTAQQSGGGLYMTNASGTADEATVFEANVAENDNGDGKFGGGGLMFKTTSADATWSGGLFTGNRNTSAKFAAGGGIYLLVDGAGSIVASDITAEYNDAPYTGGGMYLYGAPITLRDSLTQYNTSTSPGTGYGAGTSLNLSSGKMITLERVEFRGNVGWYAGATDVYDAEVTFVDCILEENEANNAYGALLIDSNGTLTVENTDLGLDALDNSPVDVYVNSSGNTYNYGNDASFTCSYDLGSCF